MATIGSLQRPKPISSISLPANNLIQKPSRPSTIKRRSTLKRSFDDSSLMEVPSSPSKRSRVEFKTDVDIVSADDEDELDPLLIREQVRRALDRHANHDDDEYERIRGLFGALPANSNAPSTRHLRYHLQALDANVSRLRKDCGSLVQETLSSEWVGRDDNYTACFVRYVGNLAVAQTGFISSIVRMLVDLLGPQKTRRLPDSKPVRAPKIHRKVMDALKYLAELVPAVGSSLAHSIATKLDFEFSKPNDRLVFVKNFMELIRYTPEMRGEILTSVMRQLIKLDTAIQTDLDDEDEDFEDDILQHMSSSQTLAYNDSQRTARNLASDEDELMSSDESESEDEDEEGDPEEARRKMLKENVRQVDVLMDTLFNYYDDVMSSADLQMQDDAFEQLIAQFSNLILPTYRSRHPQFLVFHFAQTSPQRIDRFVTYCLATLLDPTYSSAMHQSAAAYMAGFIGRASRVPKELVEDCLGVLCSSMNGLYEKYNRQCQGPDIKRYGDFYAMYQAVMYIICFRWQELCESMQDEEGDDIEDAQVAQKAAPPLRHEIWTALHNATFSKLNPLRVCTPGIVEQFDVITQQLNWIYVHSIIDSNKRVRLMLGGNWRSVGDIDINQPDRDTSWVGENGMLEGYFPYDPYHLPISQRWIQNDYVEWRGVPQPEEDDSPEEELEDDSDEEGDVARDSDTMDSDDE